MRVNDLFEADIGIHELPRGYASEKEDKTTLDLSDTRKTRLTLAQLNRIRILNDVKKLEHAKKLEGLSKQYSAPAEQGGM